MPKYLEPQVGALAPFARRLTLGSTTTIARKVGIAAFAVQAAACGSSTTQTQPPGGTGSPSSAVSGANGGQSDTSGTATGSSSESGTTGASAGVGGSSPSGTTGASGGANGDTGSSTETGASGVSSPTTTGSDSGASTTETADAATSGTTAPVVTGDGGPISTGILGAKPNMGWESWWSTHTCNPSEAEVEAIADVIVSKFQSFGYQYILIDDCWYNGFDEYGRWKADTNKFPNGWAGAASYVHSKGLKIGIYLLPGVNDAVVAANSLVYGPNGVTTYHAKDIVTSGAGSTDKAAGATSRKLNFSNPGAVAYLQGYAKLIASWGADAVKLDFVGPGGGGGNSDNQDDIMQWRAALDATGRPIVLNLSNQLAFTAIDTWQKYSNSWRVSTDIECYCSTDTNWVHVNREIFGLGSARGLLNPNFVPYAGPGHWNDLDSLMIGEGTFDGITSDERQTQFSFWAIVGSPLIIGSDLTKLDTADYAILTNSEIIAVNQSGLPAKPVSTASNQQVWYTKQADGSIVVGLFNFDAATAQVTAQFSAVGAGSTMKVHDMVSHTDLGSSSGSFGASIPAHGSRMLKLTSP